MNELLYKKSEAVAALNKVEGFNPLEYTRKIEQENQEEQLYLDVKYRKLWFRPVSYTHLISLEYSVLASFFVAKPLRYF